MLLHAGLSNAVSAALLALLVASLARPLARRPAILHCLWLLVLVKLVTPPFYQVAVPLPQKPVGLGTDRTAAGTIILDLAGPGAPQVPGMIEERASESSFWRWIEVDWSRLCATIWLAGALASIVVAIRRIVRFQRLLNDARPVSEAIQEWVNELAANLGLTRPPTAWWTGAKVSPMLWSFGRQARLIIPLALWKSLDDRQRSTLLVHELAHLRRGDHHVRFFELLVTSLYWWHPVSWWARRALRDVEEQCCDAWVVWMFPDAAKTYAETLLETLDFLNQSDCPEPLLASGFGKVHHLRRRLTMIMSGKTSRVVNIWGALGSLAFAALLLPVSPTWAQKPADDKEDVVIGTVVVGDAQTINEGVAIADADQLIVRALAKDGDPETKFAITRYPRAASVPGVVKDGDPETEFAITVMTDDQPAVTGSGTLKQAIAMLTDQIKAIEKKGTLSESDKKLHKALAHAINEITKIARETKTEELKTAKVKAKAETRAIVLRKLDLDKAQADAKPHIIIAKKAEADKELAEATQRLDAAKKLAMANVRLNVITKDLDADKLKAIKEKQHEVAKAAAEVEKARSKVNELTKELLKKRLDLSRAAGELSRLHRETRVIKVPDGLPKGGTDVAVGRPSSASGSGSDSAQSRTIVERRVREPDSRRLAELEKKLDKLLEEVESLKKARGK
jgi:bla regulator protein BlaR1